MTQQAYAGCAVALLTQHGKEALLAPVLEPALGCRIVHTDAFDTDQLGTFTRDIDRAGSQLEAARRKARLGMSLTGCRIGLASEGAFGADPFGGFLPWDTELLVWLDDERGLELVGLAQGPAQCQQAECRSWPELLAFAERAGFPSHHLVLRPGRPDHPVLHKGLADEPALRQAFEAGLAAGHGCVWAESDLRAMANPTRQALIRRAGEDLARRLASACPACQGPGFWTAGHTPGLPCSDCGQPTRLPLALHWQCPGCGHASQVRVPQAHADPSRCEHCNP